MNVLCNSSSVRWPVLVKHIMALLTFANLTELFKGDVHYKEDFHISSRICMY